MSVFMNANFTEKRFLWWWHPPAPPSTHNTWNGGNNNGGSVSNQQGDVASPGKFTNSKAT